jgi:hypothetical protein
MCNKHYTKLNRTGRLDNVRRMAPKGLSPSERLAFIGWTVTASGCHEWRGSRSRDGYGNLSMCGVAWLAHRLAYTAANGPIPAGKVVRHTCDNPPCINPAHLTTGTIAENVHDSIARKRFANGERMPRHKLTDTDVAEIRRLAMAGVLSRDIATQFSIHQSYVTRLASGRRRVAATNPAL